MTEIINEFLTIEWQPIAIGAIQKTLFSNGKKFTILKLMDDFEEIDWCLKGHTGYIIAGEMKLEFENKMEFYKKGDQLTIESGIKHKASIDKGKFIELLLIEI